MEIPKETEKTRHPVIFNATLEEYEILRRIGARTLSNNTDTIRYLLFVYTTLHPDCLGEMSEKDHVKEQTAINFFFKKHKEDAALLALVEKRKIDLSTP